MFGAFYSGDFYFGKSIWGEIAPLRTNPDIDGILVPVFIVNGILEQDSYDSGMFLRTDNVRSEFENGEAIDSGIYIKTDKPIGQFDRLK